MVCVSSGVNVEELGATVKTMRQTREGNLIVEFGKGIKSETVVKKLKKISQEVGTISNMVNMVDIDAAVEADKVEDAIHRANINKFRGSKGGERIFFDKFTNQINWSLAVTGEMLQMPRIRTRV